MGLGERLRRSLRYYYLRIVRIKAPAESIALGVAVGVFCSAIPVGQMLVAVVLAFFLRCSKLAAALGTWVTNPLNLPIVLPIFFLIGKTVLPVDVPAVSWKQMMALSTVDMFRVGWDWFLVTTFGGFCITLPGAIVAYHVVARLVRAYHTMRAARMAERRRRQLHDGS
ncbi:MAG: uncharacterized protein PWP17_444 [Desulfomicrobiaceae bacterium]|nr:uncharacterized protein [Desulfomicrobiaceae bacterium]